MITAHCDATGGTTFGPIADALRRAFGIDAGATADDLRAAIASALAPHAADEAERTRVGGGIAILLTGSPAPPEETFFVVRLLLASLAVARPVLLVVDDLHWAAPLLLDLIEHLVQWGRGVPILILVGARPELRDRRASLTTPGILVADVVTLAGLDAGAAMRLAASVIGANDLPTTVAAKVLAPRARPPRTSCTRWPSLASAASAPARARSIVRSPRRAAPATGVARIPCLPSRCWPLSGGRAR